MDIEQYNDRQIEGLNQRGGRTLSIVDLIQAGTLNVEMAAYAMRAMAQGASLLTAARPGGAGKTTLMAAILNLLPPGVRIITYARATDRSTSISAAEPTCFLAHEIGSGHWYGYLWGSEVAQFLSLIDGPHRIASCLHADTLDELTDILCSPALGVRRSALGRVDLILFMHQDRRPQGNRRVASFYEADGHGGHRQAFRWDMESDAFEAVGPSERFEGLGEYLDFLQGLMVAGVVESRAVRRKVLEFYKVGP